MTSPISNSSSDAALHRRRQPQAAPQLAPQKAADQRADERRQPRDGFEKKPIQNRRVTDGDGFDGSAGAAGRIAALARPDGQGPAQTPSLTAIEGGRRSTDPTRGTPTARPKDDSLGSLSKKYESGNRGPGTVSGGHGDPGGVSYGSYLLSSKTGTAKEFDNWLKKNHPDYARALAGKTPGTKAYSKAWKELAAKDPKGFEAAQHDFVKQTHYDPQKKAVEKATGIDFDKRSKALRDVLWSTADQHRGGTTNIFKKALKGRDPSKMTDAEIIKAVYAERGRTRANGTLVHFTHSSHKVQDGVKNRFRNEEKDALAELAREQRNAA